MQAIRVASLGDVLTFSSIWARFMNSNMEASFINQGLWRSWDRVRLKEGQQPIRSSEDHRFDPGWPHFSFFVHFLIKPAYSNGSLVFPEYSVRNQWSARADLMLGVKIKLFLYSWCVYWCENWLTEGCVLSWHAICIGWELHPFKAGRPVISPLCWECR